MQDAEAAVKKVGLQAVKLDLPDTLFFMQDARLSQNGIIKAKRFFKEWCASGIRLCEKN